MFSEKTAPDFSCTWTASGSWSGKTVLGAQALSLLACFAALLAPALWNGYALIFYDTAGYAETVMMQRLVPGRSLFYGLFLWLSSLGWWSFWSTVVVQAAATLWLLHLLLRCLRLPSGACALLLAVVATTALTGIAWYTSQLMPDIFTPQVVLALWLLGFYWSRLRGLERAGLVLISLLGVLAHMSCLALAMGLAVITVLARLLSKRWGLEVRWLPSFGIVLLALIIMPLSHLALTGKAGFTPGGSSFLFGRLVQDGVIKRYLAEHCPQEGGRLCALQDRLPATADDFLWTGQSPFQDLGGFQKAGSELAYLTVAAMRAYPSMTLWTTIRSTAQQLVTVATGDALEEGHYDARAFFIAFTPHIAGPFREARQQQDALSQSLFDRLNLIHVPVALAAVFGLLPVAIWSVRRRRYDLAVLALFVLVALVGNAFICGALSNPHDRYQSRMVWLAPLVLGVAVTALWHRRLPLPRSESGLP